VFRHYAKAGIFARTARGVGIQHLGASRLAGLTFPVPPLAEQRRIAVVVEGRLAELREAGRSLRSALRRIAEQNSETLAAAAAGELVVPEAVLAQREGRPVEGVGDLPRTASNGGKQPSLFDRERTVVPVPEGRVTPPGWTWARVNQVGEVTLGRMREPKRHHGRHMRPYLRVANVHEDRIDTADVKKMNFTPEEYEVYGLRRAEDARKLPPSLPPVHLYREPSPRSSRA
jgi:type I restriction enzyme S subunit